MFSTDKFYEALDDIVRRRILSLLLKEDEVCVCELVEVLCLPQPKVSRHLGLLRESGIVAARRVGTWMFYRFAPQAPAWAYRIVELVAQGESEDPVFQEDAKRLERRPVRYAEADLSGRKASCRPCDDKERTAEFTAA